MENLSNEKKQAAHRLIIEAQKNYAVSLYQKNKRQKQEFYLKMIRNILDNHVLRMKLATQYKHLQRGFPVAMPDCLLELAYFIEDPDCLYKDDHIMTVIQVVNDIYFEATGKANNNAICYLVQAKEVPVFLKNLANVFYEAPKTIH